MEFTPLDNLWIVVFGLLLISLPYLYYILQSRGNESKTIHSFQEFTAEKNVVLNKVQRWRNHYILGMDTHKNLLIYYKYGQFPAEISVNLDEVDHASLDVHYEELHQGKERVKRPEYLNILLYFKDPSRSVKSISVYDKKEVAKLGDELSIANHWVQTINGQINSGQSIKLAL